MAFHAAPRTFVSTHSRPKAAGVPFYKDIHLSAGFQHTAARRRLVRKPIPPRPNMCFNTQPPEGGWGQIRIYYQFHDSFNTQPPEGGWAAPKTNPTPTQGFNTQPPEGGWTNNLVVFALPFVSTHSRLKAAGASDAFCSASCRFQHTAA